MINGFSPLRFSHYSKDLSAAVYELSRECQDRDMKRRLTEAAVVNGLMREAGYIFENDGSHGPHRRTNADSFKYHPQFEEVDDSTIPFPVSA